MKTQAIYDLQLQAWWDETLIYSDQFFDTTADISTREANEVMSLYNELQALRNSYSQHDCPRDAAEIRQHLLNSMTEVVLSFQAYFNGDPESARFYMQAAEIELIYLQQKADEMGLPRLASELVLQ